MFSWLKKNLGSFFSKDALLVYQNKLRQINLLEEEIKQLSDKELSQQTNFFRKQLEDGKTLDQILPRAFAVVRETARRTLNLRHYDVQILGGLVLYDGKIAEMDTGEGKTLVATLPIYLHALSGKGAHVITVNEYLVQRDAEWMGTIYKFLGLSVGAIVPGMSSEERNQAYCKDVTYGTSKEFGFDYLRGNMVFKSSQLIRQEFNYAIIDEADSILIDEARTPLVISGPHEVDGKIYQVANQLVKHLKAEDYEHDEKRKSVTLSDLGATHAEEILSNGGAIKEGSSLYDLENVPLLHHISQSLRAHVAFKRNRDYVVKGGQILVVDEFTGRLAQGRKFAGGLHQALEAKEKLALEPETQTLGAITLQNFFRLYKKLSGMTGTAMTEAEELEGIYNLQVVQIPPNVPCQRVDYEDEVYRKRASKLKAIINYVKQLHQAGQPMLIGTTTLDYSLQISELLAKARIKHERLDARNHEREAAIIDQAGRKGAVTIAASMAGRGTDIQLGGNAPGRIRDELTRLPESKRPAAVERIKKEVIAEREEVKKLGGLCVIATERHESRRVDNQLRGRSGRQGDPGHSKFFISLEDDLMRIFGAEKIDGMLEKLGVKADEIISHSWVTKAIERAQQKLEAYNYDMRLNLLRYDNVMNEQRAVIYNKRFDVVTQEDVSLMVDELLEEAIETLVQQCIPEGSYFEQWDGDYLKEQVELLFNKQLPIKEWLEEDGVAEREIIERLMAASKEVLSQKLEQYGAETMRLAKKQFLLLAIDTAWKQHLYNLDCLKQSMNLRAYGQKNPLNEYKTEAFRTFEQLLDKIPFMLGQMLHQFKISDKKNKEQSAQQSTKLAPLPEGTDLSNVRRNAPCPCGSGRKYKHCHGKI